MVDTPKILAALQAIHDELPALLGPDDWAHLDERVQKLLQAGAPLDAREKDGRSALEHVQHLRTLRGPAATISVGTARKLQRLLGRKR